jgi:GAF domain-containing protein/N-acetylglutamate synthase-like GNAT family acetyltransferase
MAAPTDAHASTIQTDSWLHDTLEQLIGQIRTLLDVSGVAFVTIDPDRAAIRPAAAWFASEDASRAFTPLLERPYDPGRAGVTEAAVESGTAVLIPRIGEWPGAEGLRERLSDNLAEPLAELAWDFYRTASFISCPVRTAGGRTFGVLAISSNPPLPALDAEDLRALEVFARLAALALERSELLEREAGLRREEGLVNHALRAVAASIDLDAVYAAIVEQAGELSGATQVMLTRYDPGGGELRCVAGVGLSEQMTRGRFKLGEGMIGRAAASGEPYVSKPDDSDRFVRWVVETQGVSSFMHVPIALGGRLFGVLSAMHHLPGRFGEQDLRRLVSLGIGAAGAISHALEFEHERRVARALTRGFVMSPPDPQTGLELGLVYEPVAHQVGGGDVFGVWTQPSGAVAVLVGDVSGKGLEVAAASAMVRFFVEARAWDTEHPAEVLAQANRILRTRLQRGNFATAFLAMVDDGRLRYCNAGHPPPCLLRAEGGSEALQGSGLPLGIEEDGRHEEREIDIEPGDVLFASTDGLLEARREGAFFSDARLPGLLSEYGRTLPPQAFVERIFAEVQEWAPELHDDVVVLALRRAPEVELRDEPAGGSAAQALYGEYMALVRERLGPGFVPEEAIFATERVFEEERAAFVVLYARGRPVGCGGVRSLGPELAEIKRMFVTAGARRRGHGRRLLAELERRAAEAGAKRVRLLTTDVLTEASALYESAGYTEIQAHEVEGRRDVWLERRLGH